MKLHRKSSVTEIVLQEIGLDSIKQNILQNLLLKFKWGFVLNFNLVMKKKNIV